MTKSLKCEICEMKYDQNQHIPKFFPTCGHTICISCLSGILETTRRCPFDRGNVDKSLTSAEDFPTNRFVTQQLAEEFQLEKFTICPQHERKQKFVCLVDHTVICRFCQEIGDHKGHKIIHIKDLQAQAAEKQKELEDRMNKDIKEDYKKAQATLKAGRQAIKDDIIKKMTEINDWVDKQQEKIVKNMEKLFEEEKQKSNTNAENKQLQEEVQANIEALEKMDYSPEFFNALKSNIIDKALEKRTDSELMTEIEKNIKSCINKFDNEISQFLLQYQPSLKNEEIISQTLQIEDVAAENQPIVQKPDFDWEDFADSEK